MICCLVWGLPKGPANRYIGWIVLFIWPSKILKIHSPRLAKSCKPSNSSQYHSALDNQIRPKTLQVSIYYLYTIPNYFQPNTVNSNREKSPAKWGPMPICAKSASGLVWIKKNSTTSVPTKLEKRFTCQNVWKSSSYSSLELTVVLEMWPVFGRAFSANRAKKSFQGS